MQMLMVISGALRILFEIVRMQMHPKDSIKILNAFFIHFYIDLLCLETHDSFQDNPMALSSTLWFPFLWDPPHQSRSSLHVAQRKLWTTRPIQVAFLNFECTAAVGSHHQKLRKTASHSVNGWAVAESSIDLARGCSTSVTAGTSNQPRTNCCRNSFSYSWSQ